MKQFRSILPLFLILVFSSSALSQGGPVPLCGTPTLKNPDVVLQAWKNSLAKYPHADQLDKSQAMKAPFLLGAVDTFWVYNFSTGSFDRVPAELMATGSMTYIWVALDEMQNLHIDTLTVNEFLQALEVRTPQRSRDSTKGIVALDRQFFGDPPNINTSFVKGAGDGKTHFLICDIKDGWTPVSTQGYVAGFFFDVDVDGRIPFSNRRDMLYIDSYPGIFINGTHSLEEMLNTLSHEFQHLIHWNYDPNEILFFNEGLSELAPYLCGFGLRSSSRYFRTPNVPLLGWSSSLEDYSRAALWTLYAAEQYGDTFIRNLTQNSSQGIPGFDNALIQTGIASSFQQTVRNFHLANVLGDRQFNPAYGYVDSLAFSGKPAFLRSVLGSTVSGSRSGLMPLAADYVRLAAAETLRTTFTASLGSLSVNAVQVTDAGLNVSSMTSGVPLQLTYAGSQKSEFLAVVQNPGTSGSVSYTYTSTGVTRTSTVFELSHDDGRTQYAPNMNLVAGDTVFVRFEGTEGGIIDSVALWFASTGTARLLLRDYNPQFDFASQPLSGFGGTTKMFSPVSFVVSDTGFMRTTVGLRQFAMSSYPDFVVELIYDGAVHPMLRRDTSQAVLHSYLSLSSQPQAGRIIYTSFGDFYIRVYLSPSGENPPLPLPLGFALLQNYPNPFNPVTLITYDLPVRSRVKLAVYDLLGREVDVLTDEEQDARRYTVTFDASRLSTGVYFYRLTTTGFNETKKMVLVR